MFNSMLNEKNIKFIKNPIEKKELLEELCNLEFKNGYVDSLEILKEKIFHRESLMTTGIGLGLAIPHVRMDNIKGINIVMAVVEKGIKNYESIDDETIKIVIMIVANSKQHKEHIQLLNEIVTKFKDEKFRDKLYKCKSSSEIKKLWK